MNNSYPLIELDQICWQASGTQILENVTFNIHKNEIVTIIGPNGAGKSSLVKVIAGLYAPTRGTLRKANTLKIGYMPQRLSINESLPIDVERFLKLGAGDTKDLHQICELLNIGKLKRTPLTQLSGGETQRVLLARCMLRHPDLLILDEPTQGVDINGQTELYDLIQSIRDQYQCGVLMVSHDLHVVMAQTDTVICLNKHICCQGEPENVSQHPEYKQMFGAKAAESIAVYTHDHDHDHDMHGDIIHNHCNHKH